MSSGLSKSRAGKSPLGCRKVALLTLAAVLLLTVIQVLTTVDIGLHPIRDLSYIWPNKKASRGYVAIDNFHEGTALIKRTQTVGKFVYSCDRYGFVNKSGDIILEDKFTHLDSFSEGLAAAQIDSPESNQLRFGFINASGKWAVEPEFSDAKSFSEGLAAVKVGDKYGYIDQLGKMTIAPQFDDAFGFSQGLAKVVVNGFCGFIDKTGNRVVEPRFYKAEGFSEDLALLCDTSRCGYVDRTGKIVIEQIFDDAKSFREGLAPVKKGTKWRYINKDGTYLNSDEFDQAAQFSEGLGVVGVIKTNFHNPHFGGYSGTAMAYGFIDTTGRYLIEPSILHAEPFSNGLSLISVPRSLLRGDLFGEMRDYVFVDKYGRQVSRRFKNALSFNDGLALVSDADWVGFIDTKGRLAMRFDSSDWLHRHHLPDQPKTNDGMRYGFINKSGEYLIKPRYNAASPFSGGLALVDGSGLYTAYINKSGDTVISNHGGMHKRFSEGLAAISEAPDPETIGGDRSLWGYMDTSGKLVIKHQFYEALPFSNGKAAVKISDNPDGNNWGYIDRSGNIVIPARFRRGGPFHSRLALVEYSEQRTIRYKYIDESGETQIDVSQSDFDIYYPGGVHMIDFEAPGDDDNQPIYGGIFDSFISPNRESFYSFKGPLIPAISKEAPHRMGLVNKSGDFVVEPRYLTVKPFSSGLAPVRIESQWGYVNSSGILAIPAQFDDAEPFTEERALIKKNGKYGYIDLTGRAIVESQFFQEAYAFSEGLALVQVNGRYGYINLSGDFAIMPRFIKAGSFREGVAVIGEQGTYESAQ